MSLGTCSDFEKYLPNKLQVNKPFCHLIVVRLGRLCRYIHTILKYYTCRTEQLPIYELQAPQSQNLF